MANLSEIERQKFERLFSMGGGYVMQFSDWSFSSFFRQDIGVDIYTDRFAINGTSKAKRLRTFWEIETCENVGKALDELLKTWRFQNEEGSDTKLDQLYGECCIIAARLLGKNAGKDDPEEFLGRILQHISFNDLNIRPQLAPVLEARFLEMTRCAEANLPLSAIFLCGSILEGMLLSVAMDNPAEFNSANAAPRDKDNSVRKFQDWPLASLIDVSCEVGILREDAKRFSQELRGFRNYIHPHLQMASGFKPDIYTARLCSQALRVAIIGIKENNASPPGIPKNKP